MLLGDRLKVRYAQRHVITGYLFVAPALAFLLLFGAFPIVFAFGISLHNWNMVTPVNEMRFAGVANYSHLILDDSVFRKALGNTFVFTAANVLVGLGLALSVALLVNTRVQGRTFWRVVYFLPYVTSSVAVAIVWENLYHPFGLFNRMLNLGGLPSQRFLASLDQALPSIIGVSIWHSMGYLVIIFVAGLQNIPLEYYDAAKVDGAGDWARFRHITMPLLKPTLFFVAVVSTIGSLQIFDLPFLLTEGGPIDATETVVLYLYDTAFTFARMGRASAMSFILFVIILILTIIQIRLFRERE